MGQNLLLVDLIVFRFSQAATGVSCVDITIIEPSQQVCPRIENKSQKIYDPIIFIKFLWGVATSGSFDY